MIEKNHPPIKFGKTGVLIINLGTPDSTSWLDIRKYLREFLSDRRVIEVNPVIWQIILNVFILNFRPSKTAKAYKEIWMKDKNMSPLLYYTKKQSEKISNSISKENIIIDFNLANILSYNKQGDNSSMNIGWEGTMNNRWASPTLGIIFKL